MFTEICTNLSGAFARVQMTEGWLSERVEKEEDILQVGASDSKMWDGLRRDWVRITSPPSVQGRRTAAKSRWYTLKDKWAIGWETLFRHCRTLKTSLQSLPFGFLGKEEILKVLRRSSQVRVMLNSCESTVVAGYRQFGGRWECQSRNLPCSYWSHYSFIKSLSRAYYV